MLEKKPKAFGYLHQFPLVQLIGSCSASMCQHTAFVKSREARITAREKNKVRKHYDKVSSEDQSRMFPNNTATNTEMSFKIHVDIAL